MFRSISLLDLKLGVRMLLKYPWLTVVGGLGMAVAVAIGATFFGLIYAVMEPRLPLEDGDRVVSIQLLDRAQQKRPLRHLLHDFTIWRGTVTTLHDLGAFRTSERNLVAPHRETRIISVAEMSASGFTLARVPPLLGRHLDAADERRDAPPVAVISHETWQQGFGGDPRILGKAVQIGSRRLAIVGVMPEGFAFPLNTEVWVPLRLDTADFKPRAGPILYVFGRLAPGRSFADAKAELARITERNAAVFPASPAQLRPSVLPYAYPFFDIDDLATTWAFHGLQTAISLLLVLVCANVATLIYARTATRQAEIAVRTALGASRQRIVGQLFAEALVLASVASIVGLTLSRLALREVHVVLAGAMAEFGGLPFWVNLDLSLGVTVYVAGLTIISAMIVGALPALSATGRRVQGKLKQLGGGSGLPLGRTWTILIVTQVAFAVAILPTTMYYGLQYARFGFAEPGFAADQYLVTTIGIEQDVVPSAQVQEYQRALEQRYAQRQRALLAQLRAEPGIRAVTFASSLPGEEPMAMIAVEGLPLPADSVNYSLNEGTRHGYGARPNRVDASFFDTFGIEQIGGRGFHPADQDSAAPAVIVNQAFVRTILRGAQPIGRKFEYVGRGGDASPHDAPLGRRFEIVGVVADFPRSIQPEDVTARVYHPTVRDRMYTTYFLNVQAGPPEAFAPHVRELATAIDPALEVRRAASLESVLTRSQRLLRLGALGLVLLTLSVLLLSAAGIYAMMSLAVDQRRREIGVRAALGAHSRHILVSIFARAARQLALGTALGAAASFVLDRLMWGELLNGQGAILLPSVAVVMMLVGLLAARGPARRGLGIQPTEALRA